MPDYTIANRTDYPAYCQASPMTVGSWHHEVSPASTFADRSSPAFFAVDPAVRDAGKELGVRSEEQRQTRLGATFILNIEQALVFPNSFLVVDREQRISSDSFRALGALQKAGFDEASHRVFRMESPPENPSAETAVLLGIQTNRNYFHWMLEAIPRLWLLREYGFLPDDAYVVGPDLTPWMRDMLYSFGFGGLRYSGDLRAPTRFKRLLVAARGLENIRTFAPHALALAEFRKERPSVARKLLVSRSRSSSRQISNETAIVAYAQAKGYEIVFPEAMTFDEQVRLFSSASHVVGALGAGLANAAFAPRGAALVEFSPEGRTGDATLFANLAHHWGLRYSGVVGQFRDTHERAEDRRNFEVPLDLAVAAIDAAE